MNQSNQLSFARCPCCGYRTGCATCPVCYWTNSEHGGRDATAIRDGFNTDLSLSEARLNFAIYGASHRRYVELVRPPRQDEHP